MTVIDINGLVADTGISSPFPSNSTNSTSMRNVVVSEVTIYKDKRKGIDIASVISHEPYNSDNFQPMELVLTNTGTDNDMQWIARKAKTSSIPLAPNLTRNIIGGKRKLGQLIRLNKKKKKMTDESNGFYDFLIDIEVQDGTTTLPHTVLSMEAEFQPRWS